MCRIAPTDLRRWRCRTVAWGRGVMTKLPDRRGFLAMGALGAAALLGGCTGNAPAAAPDGNPAAQGDLVTRGPVAPDGEFSGVRTAQEVRAQGRLVVGAN